MARTDFKSVDQYIATHPKDVRAILQRVRGAIRKAVPGAEEVISYQIPTYKRHGSYVVYFAGWKHHISVYPLPEGDATLDEEMAPYVAGKGTLKFALDEPVPYELIERVIALLVEQRT